MCLPSRGATPWFPRPRSAARFELERRLPPSPARAQVIISLALGSCFPVVAIFINNSVDDARLTPLANALSQACVGLSRAFGPALCAAAFSASYAAERAGAPLSGPTLGRAGAFELLMLMCIAAVWGSAALPPSVERHERRAGV